MYKKAGFTLKETEWIPKNEEYYWFLNSYGNSESNKWIGDYTDTCIKNFLGIFRTKEDAAKRLEEVKKLIK
jgi:hypothetical protein